MVTQKSEQSDLFPRRRARQLREAFLQPDPDYDFVTLPDVSPWECTTEEDFLV